MTSRPIPPGSRVAVDANILVYHFSGASPRSTELLQRCESGELEGFLPLPVWAEALHRLMLLEALQGGLMAGRNPARRLRELPETVRALRGYEQAEDAFLRMGLHPLEATLETFTLAREVRRQFGLLVNDSLLVAAMRQHSIRILATADADFKRLNDLTVWHPGDLVAPSK